jgi:antitoxin component HigA of HigAB toxin-antitoxin module
MGTLGVETVSATDLKFEVAPLRTKADYKKALAKASQLVDLSPAPGSPDHSRLETLLAQIGAYESTQVGLHENPTGAFQA